MKVVYVAGPFRGDTPWAVECNVRRAEAAALEVARLGAMPLCPHTNTRFFDGQLNGQFWVDGTLELMRRCDAVLVVGNWQLSSGTLGEIADAGSRGMPVFYSLLELGDWIELESEAA